MCVILAIAGVSSFPFFSTYVVKIYMKYYCLLSILLFSLIACGSSDDKEPQSEDVTIKCSPEKIEAVAQASQYVVNVVCSGKSGLLLPLMIAVHGSK